MNFQFNQFALFMMCLIGLIVFSTYSIIAIRRIGVIAYFKTIGQAGKVITSTLVTFVASLVGLLASSAKTSDANEATANAARGGVLNYRTGKLDDGTDAGGWYDNY